MLAELAWLRGEADLARAETERAIALALARGDEAQLEALRRQRARYTASSPGSGS